MVREVLSFEPANHSCRPRFLQRSPQPKPIASIFIQTQRSLRSLAENFWGSYSAEGKNRSGRLANVPTVDRFLIPLSFILAFFTLLSNSFQVWKMGSQAVVLLRFWSITARAENVATLQVSTISTSLYTLRNLPIFSHFLKFWHHTGKGGEFCCHILNLATFEIAASELQASQTFASSQHHCDIPDSANTFTNKNVSQKGFRGAPTAELLFPTVIKSFYRLRTLWGWGALAGQEVSISHQFSGWHWLILPMSLFGMPSKTSKYFSISPPSQLSPNFWVQVKFFFSIPLCMFF